MTCECSLTTRSRIKLHSLISLSSMHTMLAYRCLGSVYYDLKMLLFTLIELIMFILLVVNNTSNLINM